MHDEGFHIHDDGTVHTHTPETGDGHTHGHHHTKTKAGKNRLVG